METVATEMKHTPEPWDIQNKGNLHGPSARVEVVEGINRDGSVNLRCVVKMPDLSDRSYANAELIVAARNSYTKHCGPRAVKCAEGDLLGGLLASARQIVEWHGLIKQNYPDMDGLLRGIDNIRAQVARADRPE